MDSFQVSALGFLGLIYAWGTSLIVTIWFFGALLTGDMEISIAINRFGEAWIEVFIIPIAMILGIVGLHQYWKKP